MCTEAIFSALRRLGGESWISNFCSSGISDQNENELIKQEPNDWFDALGIVLSRHSEENYYLKNLNPEESNFVYNHILDELISNRLVLLTIQQKSTPFLTCLHNWASTAPFRHKKLVRIVSLDIYSLYSEGEYLSTPETKLVSILTATQKRHSKVSTEEDSITILLMPVIEKWRIALQGTSCWRILRHFASNFSELTCKTTSMSPNIRLLITTEDIDLTLNIPNFINLKFNF